MQFCIVSNALVVYSVNSRLHEKGFVVVEQEFITCLSILNLIRK